jgi:Tol biopolymer transport system component
MSRVYLFTILLLTTLIISSKSYSQDDFSNLKGPYLGQKPPGLTAEIFAPGIVNTKDNREIEGMFGADMTTFYFIRRPLGEKPKSNVMVEFKYTDNQWKKSIVIQGKSEASISPDGTTFYFKSTAMQRSTEGWSEIKSLGAPFDDIDIMRLSASSSGTYYFDTFSKKLDTPLRYSRLINGKYQQPKSLGPQFGIGKYNAHPFIAPDESYIVFDSIREGGHGSSDLYISFRKADETWGPAINLGDKINTSAAENYPSVSPDGNFIFFDKRSKNSVNGNKQVDIYWVDAKIIENLRPKF